MKHFRLAAVFAAVACLSVSHSVQADALALDTTYRADVPSIEQVLGYPTGSRISSPEAIQQYFKALAEKFPQQVVLKSYGKTWEGRDLYYAILSSAENIAQLDTITAGMQQLADPRTTSKQQADKLIDSLPASIWLSYGVHGNEISSPEAAMLTAWHLLAADDQQSKDFLDQTVVYLDPLQNPDGRGRFVSRYYMTVGSHPSSDLISEEHGQALAIFDPLSAEVDPALPISPGLARLQLKVPNPLPWTAETPSLYTLVISLYSKTDSANPIDTESCRTGFTAITFSGPRNLLHVNGNAITIAGVNRPEFHSTLGRAIPLSTMVSDIRLMKQLNVNAVRTAHYPSHPLFLELCNQAGLYAVDEADLETHGFQTLGQPAGYIAGHKNWRSAVISRVARMWGRDGNHPSVLAWSVGNECGIGKNLVDAKEWLKAREGGRRPVQ
jgi:hypothetical protein